MRYIKQLLQWLTIIWNRAKGISIGNNCIIHHTSSFSRGFANGSKGALTIAAKGQTCKGVTINCYGGKVNVKQNVFMGEYVVIYGHGGVEIGENTLIAMHACIISSNHTVPDKHTLIRSQPDILLPVKIGKDVWIGAGVKILGGVTIGDGCVIGAGAVVTKSLPAYTKAVGVPAKSVGYRND